MREPLVCQASTQPVAKATQFNSNVIHQNNHHHHHHTSFSQIQNQFFPINSLREIQLQRKKRNQSAFPQYIPSRLRLGEQTTNANKLFFFLAPKRWYRVFQTRHVDTNECVGIVNGLSGVPRRFSHPCISVGGLYLNSVFFQHKKKCIGLSVHLFII